MEKLESSLSTFSENIGNIISNNKSMEKMLKYNGSSESDSKKILQVLSTSMTERLKKTFTEMLETHGIKDVFEKAEETSRISREMNKLNSNEFGYRTTDPKMDVNLAIGPCISEVLKLAQNMENEVHEKIENAEADLAELAAEFEELTKGQ